MEYHSILMDLYQSGAVHKGHS